MNNLTQRQKAVLLELAGDVGRIKGIDLAQQLHISLRTLQQEIRIINDSQEEGIIQSNQHGYSLHPSTHLPQSFFILQRKEEDISLAIIKLLILVDTPQNIDELAESFYISTSSLQQRIVQIQKILQPYALFLGRKKHHVWIEGKELAKRRMIRDLIYQEAEPVFINLDSCASYFEDMDILRIRDIILLAIQHYNCYVEDCYSTNLIINITIALNRIRKGFVMEPLEEKIFNTEILEYKIAKEICDHYSNHWHLPFQNHDLHYISMLIMGQIKPELLQQKLGNSISSTNQEFQNKVEDILKRTLNYYMLHINYDTFLYNFILHVDALIKRAKTNQYASNAIVNNIKVSCPFIYDVAVFLAKEIEDVFKIQVTDEEIGFLSMHIGFVIENSNHEIARVRVLLLCNEYHHAIDYMLQKLKEDYEKKIEITNVITNFKDDCFESSSDLIISTLPIRIIGKKVVLISPFYTSTDQLKIDNAINICLQEQQKRRDKQLLLTYFQEELFFKDTSLHKKEDVIRFLANKIIDFGLAESGFTQSVLKREQMSSTCFFDTFAIPHAIELNAKKTMFCVLVNEEGITWDNHEIKLVFMIAVQQKDRKAFMKIYNGIIQTLCHIEKVSQLVKADNLIEFIKCFKE